MSTRCRLTLRTLVCGCFVLLAWPLSTEAALSNQDKTFLASIAAQTPPLEEPTLGASRQKKRALARMVREQQRPTSSMGELGSLCLSEGECRRYRRHRRYRRYRMGPRGAHWYLWRGWWQLGSGYGAALVTGIAGLAISSANGADLPVRLFFGMMMIPVAGPLISFIIAMTNIGRGTVGEDVGWILGGIGALAVLAPQVIGLVFVIIGYTTLSRLDRGYYGSKPKEDKPYWAVTPYAAPDGAGLAVYGRF